MPLPKLRTWETQAHLILQIRSSKVKEHQAKNQYRIYKFNKARRLTLTNKKTCLEGWKGRKKSKAYPEGRKNEYIRKWKAKMIALKV